MTVKIVTDNVADLPPQVAQELTITVVIVIELRQNFANEYRVFTQDS